MQDRFKFRSYGRPNSIIEGMQNIYTFEEKENDYINVKVDKGWVAFVKKEDLKIMQCTGLKDKNGKLIYEGDILKGIKSTSNSAISAKVIYKIGVVKIFDNMFVASCQDIKNSCTLFCQCDWIRTEIIGNIYENGDLLNEQIS